MSKLAVVCAALLIAAPAVGRAADKKMDPQAMQEMMMKAASPGPQHQILKKLEGEWDVTVTSQMDPTKPADTNKSTSSIKILMDGRYCQEQSTGEMMGMPFTGMGITGYDNTLKKYESIWIDNMGTGIMKSEGVMDKTGTSINWTAEMIDPATGKLAKFRMVTTIPDENHHTFAMYGKGPDGKELKMLNLDYARKAMGAAN